MTIFQTISVLLLIASLSGYLNHRFLGLPPAIGIMAVSLTFSACMVLLSTVGVINLSTPAELVRDLDFESLLLHGMLSFLLFAGALHIDLDELRSQKGVIATLATVGVLIATFLTGTIFWLFTGLFGIEMPYIIALLFGAIIAPTDPIAVLGILKHVGVPKTLQVKISGESLFNDGIGVVVFLAISGIAFGGPVSALSVAGTLAREVAGGVALGFVGGWGFYRLLRTVDDYAVEILLTLALAAGGYALAEYLHVSAPITAVVAGLFIGNHGRSFAMSATTREHLDTFWELIDEFLNAVLFVLIGLEIIALSISLKFVLLGALSIVAMLIGRWFSVCIPVLALKRIRTFSPGAIKILTWGGLRGGISVALALSLPLMEHHDLLVVATYITVLFSILVQGTTLSLLKSRS